MYIITLDGIGESGAYCVLDENGTQVLYMFEEEDDALRFATMLEEEREYPPMHVVYVDDDVIIDACKENDYEYSIFTCNDFVIPPEENYDPF